MRKQWYKLVDVEMNNRVIIDNTFMSLIRAAQQNEFYAKHDTPYRWKVVGVEVF